MAFTIPFTRLILESSAAANVATEAAVSVKVISIASINRPSQTKIQEVDQKVNSTKVSPNVILSLRALLRLRVSEVLIFYRKGEAQRENRKERISFGSTFLLHPFWSAPFFDSVFPLCFFMRSKLSMTWHALVDTGALAGSDYFLSA